VELVFDISKGTYKRVAGDKSDPRSKMFSVQCMETANGTYYFALTYNKVEIWGKPYENKPSGSEVVNDMKIWHQAGAHPPA